MLSCLLCLRSTDTCLKVLETNVGLGRKLSLLLGGVIQVMFVIGSIYPTLFSDRFGRRQPMMWGSFGLFICMMMISILLSFRGTPFPLFPPVLQVVQ